MPCFRRSTYSGRFKASHDTYTSSSSYSNNRQSHKPNRLEEFSFAHKQQNGWVPLDPLADQSVISEIHRGSGSREQAIFDEDGLPLQGIKVKSDLEWSVSPKP